MDTVEKIGSDQKTSSFIFSGCKSAFNLIKEGKEKQAKEMFPWEYYLIQKYLYFDFKNLSELLANKLMVYGQ
jgi:hypothetical protein